MESELVVVVGAGIGGLSAAIRLATAGKRVVVFEQNDRVGGKMEQVEQDGFRWDTGPSVITMRPVFEELFAAAGRRLEDYLTLLPLDPLTRYFYPDGFRLDIRRDLPATLREIEALGEGEVEGYLRFLAYTARLHRIVGPAFLYGGAPTLHSFRSVAPRDYLGFDPLRTMDQAIGRYVHTRHLRQLFGRFATYVGASPYQAPATLNVIAHVELNGGVWYPKGGIYQIARALERLAGELGVEVHTGTRVEQILLEGGRVAGVKLTGGETVKTAVVIANVDVTPLYRSLLPPEPAVLRRRNALEKLEPSGSGFVLLLGIQDVHPNLAHHNLFFSTDYRQEFADIFRAGKPPVEPTIYLAITSKTDPDHAPPGCENWFILVNTPPLGPGFNWDREADAYRDRILNLLARKGFSLEGKIRVEKRLSPADLERLTGAHRGALYGASSNRRLAAFLRPSNRVTQIPGLFLSGGTAHPGGGVPLVMLSGKLAAQAVLDCFPPRS